MKQVKGATFVYFVKTIRADKSGIYDKYLNKDDLDIIGKRISPTMWYPYETFKKCFNAVVEVIAKRNPEKVKDWGKLYGEMIMTDAYKATIKEGKPLEHIKRVPVYIKSFMDFGNTEAIVEAPNRVVLVMKDYDPDFAPFYVFLEGWFQRMAELCGAKNVECKIVEKSWVNKKSTTSYIITWS